MISVDGLARYDLSDRQSFEDSAMSVTEQRLFAAAHELGSVLKTRRLRLVLAESCTAGVVSMAISDVPGISEWFCGSAVTYRDETKAAWLDVSRPHLADPKIGAVSPHVAEQMCQGALLWDGIVFIGVAIRGESGVTVQRRALQDSDPPTRSLRFTRQREAAELVIRAILHRIEQQRA